MTTFSLIMLTSILYSECWGQTSYPTVLPLPCQTNMYEVVQSRLVSKCSSARLYFWGRCCRFAYTRLRVVNVLYANICIGGNGSSRWEVDTTWSEFSTSLCRIYDRNPKSSPRNCDKRFGLYLSVFCDLPIEGTEMGAILQVTGTSNVEGPER